MKQIEVQIMGQSYILATSLEGEALLRGAVAKVDTAMCQIRDAGKIKARDRIAVLAALNIAAQGLSNAASVSAESAQTSAASTLAAPAATTPDYAQLMAKLDNALAGDGQLL
jgi:cell division protein ZapA